MNHVTRAIAACAAACLSMSTPQGTGGPVSLEPGDGRLSELAFMTGSWVNASGQRQSEEHWTNVAGNSMFGVARSINKDKTVFFEFFRVVAKGDEVVFHASPAGRHPPTPFTLKSCENRRVVFENLKHDFPQRIIYWRDKDRLHARIEGNAGGSEKSTEWSWQRAHVVVQQAP